MEMEGGTDSTRFPDPSRPAPRLRLPTHTVIVTYGLLVLNGLVFLADTLLNGRLTQLGALLPAWVGRYGEWWRLILAGFLHADLLHIGFNLYALYNLGRLLERFYGPARTLIVYALSLIGSSALVLLLSSPEIPTVGASGAIMGVLGGLLAYYWRYQDMLVGGRNYLSQLIRLALINIGIGLLPGISMWGHAGGFLTGLGAGWALHPRYTYQGGFTPELREQPLPSASKLEVLGILLVEAVMIVLALGWRF
jgi:membrane associated rhomboid family serine protease